MSSKLEKFIKTGAGVKYHVLGGVSLLALSAAAYYIAAPSCDLFGCTKGSPEFMLAAGLGALYAVNSMVRGTITTLRKAFNKKAEPYSKARAARSLVLGTIGFVAAAAFVYPVFLAVSSAVLTTGIYGLAGITAVAVVATATAYLTIQGARKTTSNVKTLLKKPAVAPAPAV